MRSHSIALPLALLLSLVSGASSDLSPATALFERHFEAIGGTQRLAQIKSVLVTGVVQNAGQQYPFRFQTRPPGLLLLETIDDKGKPVTIGRSPDSHLWQKDAKGCHDLERSAWPELSALAIAFTPGSQSFLAERLADALCEPVFTQGHQTIAVGAKRNGTFSRMFFEDETGRLFRVGYTMVEDYRPVEGIQFPHTFRAVNGRVYRVQNLSFREDLPVATFEPPVPRGGFLSHLNSASPGAQQQTRTLLSTPGKIEVVRHPRPSVSLLRKPSTCPTWDPNSGRNSQVDLRNADVRKLDLTTNAADLLHADFDARTLWPNRLPAGFSPSDIMELGKDPGLGVRALHKQGITGRGIGIGIIDSALLTTHQEYKDRLRLYEEVGCPDGLAAHMHGTAVASIALGKTCGVAPGADLYFIASRNSAFVKGQMKLDFRPIAQSIHRLLDINTNLPPERRIRVISLSMGWTQGETGYDETMSAVARATREGVFVLSTSLRKTHHLYFDGLGRAAMADPNCFDTYGPGSWWAHLFWNGEMRFKPGKRLCVPMDTRTTASPAGPNEYVHYDYSGWSWAVPWVAGLYALACEARPSITPEEFWSAALKTGRTIQVTHDGQTIPFGTIADPAALVTLLRKPSLLAGFYSESAAY